jgi:hypothetical protein
MADPVRFASVHCSIEIARPAPGVVLVSLSGTDGGEFADAPFVELERDFKHDAPLELFIDARLGRAASIEVSGQWAAWLRKHKLRYAHISMLTRTRFIQLSADLVKRFSELDMMRLYTDPASFDAALRESVERVRSARAT